MAERRPYTVDGDMTPITATVQQFTKLTGLGKTRIFEMLKAGELQSIKPFKCRLILVESYVDFVRRQAEAECRSKLSGSVRLRSRG